MNMNNSEFVKNSQASAVEFIDYNGNFPNLCSGTLIIKVNEKIYELDHILISGGSVWFDDDWNEHVEDGDWSLSSLPQEIQHLHDEILALVQQHIPCGCCGGCV